MIKTITADRNKYYKQPTDAFREIKLACRLLLRQSPLALTVLNTSYLRFFINDHLIPAVKLGIRYQLLFSFLPHRPFKLGCIGSSEPTFFPFRYGHHVYFGQNNSGIRVIRFLRQAQEKYSWNPLLRIILLLYREASPKHQHSNPEPDKQLLRWLLALHFPSPNNTPIYSPPSTLPTYSPGLTNGQAGKSEKIKLRSGLQVITSGTPSGPCVGMGSGNIFTKSHRSRFPLG